MNSRKKAVRFFRPPEYICPVCTLLAHLSISYSCLLHLKDATDGDGNGNSDDDECIGGGGGSTTMGK